MSDEMKGLLEEGAYEEGRRAAGMGAPINPNLPKDPMLAEPFVRGHFEEKAAKQDASR